MWRNQASFYPPSKFESRVQALLDPYLQAIRTSSSPQLPPARKGIDLAVFSSSYWDLAVWAEEDAKAGVSVSTGIGDQRLTAWRSRMVDMIAALSTRVAGARLAWRSAHVPTSDVRGTTRWFLDSMRLKFDKSGVTDGNPIMSPLRVLQLNAARRSMLPLKPYDTVSGKSTGLQWSSTKQPHIGDIPFGEVTLGQAGHTDVARPGVVPHAYLFWDMVFAQLRE